MGDSVEIFLLDCESSYKDIKQAIFSGTDIYLNKEYGKSLSGIYRDEYLITLCEKKVEIFALTKKIKELEKITDNIINVLRISVNTKQMMVTKNIDNEKTTEIVDGIYRPSIKTKLKKRILTAIEKI